MQDRPTAKELLGAIADFLIKEAIPVLEEKDKLLGYKALVSWNMLGVIGREIEKEEAILEEDIRGLQEVLGKKSESVSGSPMRLDDKKETSVQLSKLLLDKIQKEEISSPQSPEWKFVKESLKRKLAISNPRFPT